MILSKLQSGQPNVEKDNNGKYFFDVNEDDISTDNVKPELVFKNYLLVKSCGMQ